MQNLTYALKNLVVYPGTPTIKDATNHWGGREEVREKNSFFYVLEGSFALTVNEHNYIVKKNQLAFMPMGYDCAHWKLPGVDLRVIYFPITLFCDGEDIFDMYGCKEDTHVVSLPKDEVMDIFNRTQFPPEITDNVPLRMTWCSENIRLCSLFIQAKIRLMNAHQDFKDVISYMQNHLAEDIPLDTLAEKLHLNSSYFSTKFKDTMGLSPLKYMMQMRANEAARLLRDTDLPISKICKTLGITNLYYFQRFFEKQMGIRPEAYRNMFTKPVILRSSET